MCPPCIGYTYESDSGLARSWIDHVICSQVSSALISGLQAFHLGSILSDHSPRFFLLNIQPNILPTSAGRTLGIPHHAHIDWDKVNSSNIQNYCEMLSHSLLPLPASVSNCVSSCCVNHWGDLDTWAQNLTSSLLDCAFKYFPICRYLSTRKLVGWKELLPAQRIVPISGRYKVWVEAGCPVSGVLFQIKKNVKSRYKYEVYRLKRRQDILLQKKLAQLFSGKGFGQRSVGLTIPIHAHLPVLMVYLVARTFPTLLLLSFNMFLMLILVPHFHHMSLTLFWGCLFFR